MSLAGRGLPVYASLFDHVVVNMSTVLDEFNLSILDAAQPHPGGHHPGNAGRAQHRPLHGSRRQAEARPQSVDRPEPRRQRHPRRHDPGAPVAPIRRQTARAPAAWSFRPPTKARRCSSPTRTCARRSPAPWPPGRTRRRPPAPDPRRLAPPLARRRPRRLSAAWLHPGQSRGAPRTARRERHHRQAPDPHQRALRETPVGLDLIQPTGLGRRAPARTSMTIAFGSSFFGSG